ncbi:DUF1569 domain-containing protein [Bizionia sp. KMM 8389]
MNPTKTQFLITSLASYLENAETSNPQVSDANIAWHIDHSCKVINQVSKALIESEPSLYTNNFSFVGKVFFTLGFFPRGKAKAPKHVLPPDVILKENLISQLEKAQQNVLKITELETNAHFKHPFFGNINKKRIFRFLELHTAHHLKIIKTILA